MSRDACTTCGKDFPTALGIVRDGACRACAAAARPVEASDDDDNGSRARFDAQCWSMVIADKRPPAAVAEVLGSSLDAVVCAVLRYRENAAMPLEAVQAAMRAAERNRAQPVPPPAPPRPEGAQAPRRRRQKPKGPHLPAWARPG